MNIESTGGPNVVSMIDYRDPAQHPAMCQIEAYWEGLRSGRAVPLRSDVDPRGIDRALEYAFVLERIAPGIARFRLAGMHLNDLMGMEVRGMPLTALFTPDARRAVSDTLEHVFEEPATARFFMASDKGIGKPALAAEVLLLPLKSDLGDVSRALGCFVSEGVIGRTPRRFALLEQEIRRIKPNMPHFTGVRSAGPARAPAAKGVLEPSFAEPAAPFRDRMPPADKPAPTTADAGAADARRGSERPYLRLIRPED